MFSPPRTPAPPDKPPRKRLNPRKTAAQEKLARARRGNSAPTSEPAPSTYLERTRGRTPRPGKTSNAGLSDGRFAEKRETISARRLEEVARRRREDSARAASVSTEPEKSRAKLSDIKPNDDFDVFEDAQDLQAGDFATPKRALKREDLEFFSLPTPTSTIKRNLKSESLRLKPESLLKPETKMGTDFATPKRPRDSEQPKVVEPPTPVSTVKPNLAKRSHDEFLKDSKRHVPSPQTRAKEPAINPRKPASYIKPNSKPKTTHEQFLEDLEKHGWRYDRRSGSDRPKPEENKRSATPPPFPKPAFQHIPVPVNIPVQPAPSPFYAPYVRPVPEELELEKARIQELSPSPAPSPAPRPAPAPAPRPKSPSPSPLPTISQLLATQLHEDPTARQKALAALIFHLNTDSISNCADNLLIAIARKLAGAEGLLDPFIAVLTRVSEHPFDKLAAFIPPFPVASVSAALQREMKKFWCTECSIASHLMVSMGLTLDVFRVCFSEDSRESRECAMGMIRELDVPLPVRKELVCRLLSIPQLIESGKLGEALDLLRPVLDSEDAGARVENGAALLSALLTPWNEASVRMLVPRGIGKVHDPHIVALAAEGRAADFERAGLDPGDVVRLLMELGRRSSVDEFSMVLLRFLESGADEASTVFWRLHGVAPSEVECVLGKLGEELEPWRIARVVQILMEGLAVHSREAGMDVLYETLVKRNAATVLAYLSSHSDRDIEDAVSNWLWRYISTDESISMPILLSTWLSAFPSSAPSICPHKLPIDRLAAALRPHSILSRHGTPSLARLIRQSEPRLHEWGHFFSALVGEGRTKFAVEMCNALGTREGEEFVGGWDCVG